jgi:Na+/melibiose symporter-like transporter
MTQASTRPRGTIAAHPYASAGIALLVSAGIVLALVTPIYARTTPKLGDFPFFYWYLLVIMPVISLFLWIAAQLQKRLEPPSAGENGDAR